MFTKNKVSQIVFTAIVLLTVTLSTYQAPAASAQGPDDGIVRGYNAETGKVAMLSGADSEPITILSAMANGLSDEQRADALVQSFAPEFGITNPAADLQIAEQNQSSTDRITTRYQQYYKGVPVMAGELIVNASEQGALYSMNGEVAQALSLDTNPTITASEALTIAKQGMSKWYQDETTNYAASADAVLWIFDESLLRPSIRPAELVWRLELISLNQAEPVRELVLVNAKTGNISLHFNQIDTAWHNVADQAGSNQATLPQEDVPTATPTTEVVVTETPLPTDTVEPTITPEESQTYATPTTTATPLAQPTEEELSAQVITTYYVDIVNGNDSNDCVTTSTPCQNIKQAIEKGSGVGDIIKVAGGTYTWTNSALPARLNWQNVVITDRSLTLSGGWNTTFSTQNSVSIIDGQNNKQCILANNGPTIIEYFILQNCSQGDGAALYIAGVTSYTVRNMTIKNNTGSGKGIGMYVAGSTGTITNSTISGNGSGSTTNGGGIYFLSGSVATIQNSTIAYNTAQNGGGIARNSDSGAITIRNSIVANNTATTSGPDCNGTFSSITYSIIETTSGCTITSSSNNLNVDPQIDSSLTGTLQVHVLLSGSPAIEAGTSTGCPAADQVGTARPQATYCDIGAYEFPGTPGVASVVLVSSGSSQKAPVSGAFSNPLVVVVKDANGFLVNGATVTFTAPASGASGTFANTSNNVTTAVTNASGIATASAYTANATAGSYVVEATVSGVASPAQFSLENYTPTATTISVNAGSSQVAKPSTAYTTALKALVVDQYARPMQGVSVTFTAPSSGASGVFSLSSTNTTTVTTAVNGIATASTFTANSTLGALTVDATVSGVGTPASFQLMNSAGQYVSPSGTNGTSCANIASPCLTINYAISKAVTDDVIFVQTGTYTGTGSAVVTLSKNVTLSGGWNGTFDSQNGYSTISGGAARNGINYTASAGTSNVRRFIVQNSLVGIEHGSIGVLNVDQSSTINNQNGTRSTNNSGQFNLTNVTISGNVASGLAGSAISIAGGTVNIKSSTITNNSGGSYAIYALNGTAHVTIENSILAGNTNSGDCAVTSSTMVSNGYNIFGSSPACYSYGSPNFVPLASDQVGVNPNLSTLLPDGYHILFAGSPALNAANPSTCPSTDQRGVTRPQETGCDIGAVETVISNGPITSIMILSGNNQTSGAGYPFASPLSVMVFDTQGNPVNSQDVTFTAPASGASLTFSGTSTNMTTIVSDQNGMAATSSMTANLINGVYNVVVSAGSASPVNFSLRNGTWYVSTAGNNSNTCSTPASPCANLGGVLSKPGFGAGDAIKIAAGTYDNVSNTINKNAYISGGWDNTFTTQNGQTHITDPITVNSNIAATISNINIHDTGSSGINNSGNLTLNNVAIYNNHATTSGGGIYQSAGQLTLNNVTISKNSIDSTYSPGTVLSGGGIYVAGGTISINNSTITQNVVTDSEEYSHGGGIANPSNLPLAIKNSIISGNVADVGQDCYRLATSGGHNLIGTTLGCDISAGTGDIFGPENPNALAVLGDLQDNGGGTWTHALLTGSTAIDAGDPSTCTATDSRGVARPQGAACDIGAYEGEASQTITGIFRTYSSGNSYNELLPGNIQCQGTLAACLASPGSSNPDVLNAHRNAIAVYDFYVQHFGRYSFDNNNGPIISTVDFGTGFDNAFWSGSQMVYGDAYDYVKADDVVGHELTHGVTQYESNLFYFYQSGAINESLSDVFGEYYDQNVNASGTDHDGPTYNWLMGEDTNASGTGQIRSMSNPPAYNDPDKMTSTLYVKTDVDSGGVHSNSGVNNKAAFLMVDGGTFNLKTVTGIGWDKTAAIYYEANTNLLSSGADYSDLYYALQQACSTLATANVKGITSADCVQVKNAIDAVQMNSQPVAGFNQDALVCPAGTTTAPSLNLFSDNLENGSGKWNLGYGSWAVEDFYASSPTHHLYGDDSYAYSSPTLQTENGILLPAGTSYLYFKHAFGFEYFGATYYDGGILEYSTNNGSTWQDAKPLFSEGKNYGGTIYQYDNNPLAGKSAFVGDSHGYISTRYNLTPLAGQTVKFRWSIGTDSIGSYLGWMIDDVKVYTCVGSPSIPTLQTPASNALSTTYQPFLNWSDSTTNLHHYQLQVATNNTFTSPVYDQTNLLVSQFNVPSDLNPNTTYYWRVRAFNAINETLGWSTVFSFRTALLPPTLAGPTSGDTLATNFPTFTWNAVPGASGYTVQASTSNTFAALLVNAAATTTSYTPATALPGGVPIYWRVASTGTNGPSAWSSVRTIYLPFMTSPANNGYTTTQTPIFTWAAITGALDYKLEVDTSNSFISPELQHSQASGTSYLSTPLDYGTHYWRMQVHTASGWTDWTPGWKFTIAPPVSTAPVLNQPINAALVNDNTPTLSWNLSVEDDRYEVQIDTINTFASPDQTYLSGPGTTSYTAGTLSDGMYYWRVRISNYLSGTGPWSAYRSFTVDTIAPSVPALSNPANAASVIGTPAFSWLAATGASKYQFEYDNDGDFSSPAFTSAELTVLTITPPAIPLGSYSWHVRAKDTAGNWSAWSAPRAITINPAVPLAPTLTAPASAALINDDTPTFTWAAVPYGSNYQIQISNSSTFTVVQQGPDPIAALTYDATTLPDGIYYWRVRAFNAAFTPVPGAWSLVRSFTVDTIAPSIPTLSTPANAASVVGTPAFSWLAASGASKYQFEYDNDSDFSSPTFTSAELTTTSFTPPAIPVGSYSWHVRAKDAAGNWSLLWSSARTITINPPTPVAPALTAPASAALTNDNTPTFTWAAVPYGDKYQIQISNSSTFAIVQQGPDPIAALTYDATTLPDGIYYWRVRAFNAAFTPVPGAWSLVRSFTVDTIAPSIPTLSTPANAASVVGTPAFSWLAASGASKYQFQYDDDTFVNNVVVPADFSSPVFTSAELTVLTITPPAMAANPISYSWRVRAKDAAGNWSAWSTPRTININAPAPSVPTLVSPSNGSISQNPSVNLSWNSATNAVKYDVELDNNSTFTSREFFTLQPISATNISTSQLPDGVYYWRVRSINITNGTSAWSTVWRVTVAQPIPLAPVLMSPSDGAEDVTGTPEFSWQVSVGGLTYQIQVDDNADFSSPEFDDTAGTNTRTPLSTLANGTYYWHVRAFNVYSNPGAWSTARSLTISVP